MLKTAVLNTGDHSRDVAGMTYVYPVVSRRAGGVSIGINLNPNNACNWRCVYCQVPDLQRGAPPLIDLVLLERELDAMLGEVLTGDFMARHVPEGMRRLNDLAFSGNGEPTQAAEFAEAIGVVDAVLRRYGVLGQIKVVLITNGSQVYKAAVQEALLALARLNGEVWFKVDRAPGDGFSEVNQVVLKADKVRAALVAAAVRCSTWVQTCFFATDGVLPDESEVAAYLAFLESARDAGAPLAGVLLYGLARPSLQPEAPRLSAAPAPWMEALAERIRALGLEVRLSV
ncbi:radical SAM protein [Chitinibacteraceae bacterium HSL-7]